MIWTLVLRLLNTIGRWQDRRSIIHQLSRLDDRLLQDIGIHRYEIASVARRSTKSMPASDNGHGKAAALPNGALMERSCRAVPGCV